MTSALISIRTINPASTGTAPEFAALPSTDLAIGNEVTSTERRIYREFDGGLAETGGQISRIVRDLLRIIPNDLGNLVADSILAKNRGLEAPIYTDVTNVTEEIDPTVSYLIEVEASDFGGYNLRVTFQMNGVPAGPMPMNSFIDVVNMARSAANVQYAQTNRLIPAYKMILK